MPEPYLAALPFLLLIAVAFWGVRMKKKCPIENPTPPVWPQAENPSLALELADSLETVDKLLDSPETNVAAANRESAIRLQHLDFVLIPLYVLFFAVTALRIGTREQALAPIVLALVTAFFDILEDVQIIAMVKRKSRSSAKRFGRLKWLFYFATVGAEGMVLLLLAYADLTARHVAAGGVLGVMLILTGIGGAISALKASFNGILSATSLSLFVLVPLSLTPLIFLAPFSWRDVIAYSALLRVPLLLAVIVVGLPFIAFFTGAKSLLKGLFDLTPAGLFVAALAAAAAARTASVTAALILAHAAERFRVAPVPQLPGELVCLLTTVAVSAPLIVFAMGFSMPEARNRLSCHRRYRWGSCGCSRQFVTGLAERRPRRNTPPRIEFAGVCKCACAHRAVRGVS